MDGLLLEDDGLLLEADGRATLLLEADGRAAVRPTVEDVLIAFNSIFVEDDGTDVCSSSIVGASEGNDMKCPLLTVLKRVVGANVSAAVMLFVPESSMT